jgi:type IV secretory pathway VirB10-like protein
MLNKFARHTALVLLLHVTAGAAFAQFAWIDHQGVRQYSDQPPPPSIPKNRILKQPGVVLRTPADEIPAPAAVTGAVNGATAPTAGTPAAGKPLADKGPQTTAEKNADYVKRRSDQAEKDKKDAEEAKLADAKRKNCERAQQYARSLKSGERISSMDKDGNRVYMADDQRAKEASDTSRALENCK